MYRYIAAVILLSTLCFANQSGVKERFKGEDLLILQALDAQKMGEGNISGALYRELYDKTNDEIYIRNSIQLFLSVGNWNEAKPLIQQGLEKYPQDSDYNRFYIAVIVNEGNIQDALKLAEELTKREKTAQNMQLLGAIYFYQQEYNMALKYFEGAYNLAATEHLLIQIAELYIKLNQASKAIAQLETYARLNGCTRLICYKLIEIYGKDKNINGVLNVYKKLYAAFKDEEEAQKIFEILMFQDKQNEAVEFLEKSGSNPDLLIEMYLIQKQYDKAIKLADTLYQETNNNEYLLKTAIYEYEGAQNKSSVLRSVSEKFERYISDKSEALYLNYYGYLLIDHDVNITKGMGLVQKALKLEPDSPYYQDSLAWGLYKQNRCQEALEIMKKVLEKLNDKEVIEHFEAMKSCENKDTKTE
jgi:tetratricopeptide (TPR) repeat protein